MVFLGANAEDAAPHPYRCSEATSGDQYPNQRAQLAWDTLPSDLHPDSEEVFRDATSITWIPPNIFEVEKISRNGRVLLKFWEKHKCLGCERQILVGETTMSTPDKRCNATLVIRGRCRTCRDQRRPTRSRQKPSAAKLSGSDTLSHGEQLDGPSGTGLGTPNATTRTPSEGSDKPSPTSSSAAAQQSSAVEPVTASSVLEWSDAQLAGYFLHCKESCSLDDLPIKLQSDSEALLHTATKIVWLAPDVIVVVRPHPRTISSVHLYQVKQCLQCTQNILDRGDTWNADKKIYANVGGKCRKCEFPQTPGSRGPNNTALAESRLFEPFVEGSADAETVEPPLLDGEDLESFLERQLTHYLNGEAATTAADTL